MGILYVTPFVWMSISPSQPPSPCSKQQEIFRLCASFLKSCSVGSDEIFSIHPQDLEDFSIILFSKTTDHLWQGLLLS